MILSNYIEQDEDKFAYLKIKVVPKSRITEFFAIMDDDTLKVRVKSPPENWKANKELILFIAKELLVDTKRIKILSGEQNQLKIIRVDLT